MTLSEYKRQIGVAVTIALVGALALGVFANYSFPSQTSGVSLPPAQSTSTSSSRSTLITLTTTTTMITLPVTGPTSSTSENGTIVLPVAGPPTANFTQVVATAISSPSVQGYVAKNVNDSREYAIKQVSQGENEPSLVFVTFSVTDNRTVSGNWTSGYSLTYSQRIALNVTVQFTPPSTYQVSNVAIHDLPNSSQSISFTSQQQGIIQVALSNSAVRQQYTSRSPYYVQSVTSFVGSGNQTYSGDYLVYIGQVSTSCVVGIFVNPNTNSVVTTYVDTPSECG